MTRVQPRDSTDLIRDLARDVERLGEQIARDLERTAVSFDARIDKLETRLGAGAEKFTQMDMRIVAAQATAQAAIEATAPKRIPWTRVVPISISILALAFAVTISMAQRPSRDAFDRHIELESGRVGDLERRVADLAKEVAISRSTLDTLRETLASATEPSKKPADSKPRGR